MTEIEMVVLVRHQGFLFVKKDFYYSMLSHHLISVEKVPDSV